MWKNVFYGKCESEVKFNTKNSLIDKKNTFLQLIFCVIMS